MPGHTTRGDRGHLLLEFPSDSDNVHIAVVVIGAVLVFDEQHFGDDDTMQELLRMVHAKLGKQNQVSSADVVRIIDSVKSLGCMC